MGRALVLVLILSAALLVCEAQLTFTPGWGQGKRSEATDYRNDGCSSEDSVYTIYKLIKNEAEKFLACQS
uniref:Type I adipokinetic prohormone n=1 Tax=Bombyx mori TaxID=7091 RepID=B0LUE7_BOMMO|nr:type I adipokinetic prohormone precursor [Bombyx mori]